MESREPDRHESHAGGAQRGWKFFPDFWDDLYAVMKRHQITWSQLYVGLNVSQRTVHEWRHGEPGLRANLEETVRTLRAFLKSKIENPRSVAAGEKDRAFLQRLQHVEQCVWLDEGQSVHAPTAEWERYRTWFAVQMNKPAFGMNLVLLTATLPDIYVPLRVCPLNEVPDLLYRGAEPAEIDPSRLLAHARDASNVLEDWIAGRTPDMIMLQGHPGSGKSTVARMFVLSALEAGLRTVFIPLQHVDLTRIRNTALTQDLLGQLFDDALADAGVRFTRLVEDARGQELFLVLDALDELQLLEGKAGIGHFLDALSLFTRDRSRNDRPTRILFTTRHQTASETREWLTDAARYEVLRYFYPMKRDREYQSRDLIALQHDYRDDWWRQFGQVTERGWEGLPREIDRPAFEELTSDPFNNLMVALAYVSGDANQVQRLSELFEVILTIVQKRGFDPGRGRARDIHRLPASDFEALLQDVAIAAWPNGGRAATMTSIGKVAHASGHHEGYRRYLQGAEYGEANILLQFYFRNPHEQPLDEKRVEFTHKSFSDWLVVRRLVELLGKWAATTNGTGKARHPSYDEMAQWLSISALQPEHSVLLHSEMENLDQAELEGILAVLEQPLTYACKVGYDVVARAPGTILHPNSDEQWQPDLCFGYIRRALRALWMLADICRFELNRRAGSTEGSMRRFSVKPFAFDLLETPAWEDPLGLHFRHVKAERIRLAGYGLQGVLLDGEFEDVDFTKADLSDAVLDGSRIASSNFHAAVLRNTSLEGGSLDRCSFVRALCVETCFDGARLTVCDFGAAYLNGATFEGAEVRGCGFLAADLRGMEIRGAQLDAETTFEGVKALPELLHQSITIVGKTETTDATLLDLGWRIVDGR